MLSAFDGWAMLNFWCLLWVDAVILSVNRRQCILELYVHVFEEFLLIVLIGLV